LPLVYERIPGATDDAPGFQARARGHTTVLAADGATIHLARQGAEASTLRMRWVGAAARPAMRPEAPLASHTSHFLGDAPDRWHTGIVHHQRVRYVALWSGIDAVFHGSDRALEYDFIVAPGADHRRIRLRFEGAGTVAIDPEGHLVLGTRGGDVVQRRPVLYQDLEGVRVPVTGRWRIDRATRTVGFDVGAYDRTRPLVIDPVMAFGGHLGGADSEVARSIATDAGGNVYLAGSTFSTDLGGGVAITGNPVTGSRNAFVAKLDPAGALLWTTIIGGAESDEATGVAVDADGNVYVAGNTTSPDFPVANGWQGAQPAPVAGFVAKLSPSGADLVYATYLGGVGANPAITGLAVDDARRAHVTGSTDVAFAGFARVGAVAGGGAADAFVARLDASGAVLEFGALFGGAAQDIAHGIALGPDGSIFVAGRTSSVDFPVTAGAAQAVNAGPDPALPDVDRGDAFVVRLDAGGTALAYATYLGGSGIDAARAIAVDARGRAHVTGSTRSPDFPVTGVLDPNQPRGGEDAFVARIAADGRRVDYAVILGGSDADVGTGVALDAAANPHVTGTTVSADFPQRRAAQPGVGGRSDAFVAKVMADGTRLAYATFIGGGGDEAVAGIVADAGGNVWIAGDTDDAGFPATGGGLAYTGAPRDLVIARLTVAASATSLVASSTTPLAGQAVTFAATVTGNDPTGRVVLSDGATIVATADLVSGTASFAPAAFQAGDRTFTAQYQGDHDHGPSTSNAVTVTVPVPVIAATTIDLTTSLSTLDEGDALTLGVVVSGGGVPGGTVEFRDQGTLIGTTVLREGAAFWPVSTLGAGQHVLTAHYLGDEAHAPSASAPRTVTVFARSSGKGGGGCTMSGEVAPDPLLALLLLFAFAGTMRRHGLLTRR